MRSGAHFHRLSTEKRVEHRSELTNVGPVVRAEATRVTVATELDLRTSNDHRAHYREGTKAASWRRNGRLCVPRRPQKLPRADPVRSVRLRGRERREVVFKDGGEVPNRDSVPNAAPSKSEPGARTDLFHLGKSSEQRC